jgi:hypothetical protein
VIYLNGEELTWISITVVVVMALGLFVGKFMDVFWRAKVLRSITKKDFGILGILSPDTKTIKMVVVDFGKDVIQYKGKVWIVLKDRIYRHDKPERGISLTKADLPIRWIEGIPVLYVNETSYTPIDLTGVLGEVRPEEVNSVFSSWVNNQLAKAMAKILSTFKTQQQLLIVIAILSFLAMALSYMAMSGTTNCQNAVAAGNAEIHQICLKTGACAAPVTNSGVPIGGG